MMKKRRLVTLGLLLVVWTGIKPLAVLGQFKSGLTDVNMAVTSVVYGLPFMMLTPIHPGIEIGATFLKKEKEKASHSFNAVAGYYYHSLIAHAINLRGEYSYQRRIKNFIGIDLAAGLGYLHSFYPGQGYQFNPEQNEYEAAMNSRPFGIINLGLGLSYVKAEKFQPFIHYDFTYFNPWELNPYLRSTAKLKMGVKIKL